MRRKKTEMTDVENEAAALIKARTIQTVSIPAADKLAKWGAGPWVDEPDHVTFVSSGYPCILHRNHFGAWCGYVGIPSGHPFHGKSHSDRVPSPSDLNERRLDDRTAIIPLFLAACKEDPCDGLVSLDLALDVHGGITYGAICGGSICHTPPAGETDERWWLGFDCGHCEDVQPDLKRINREFGHDFDYGTYRTMNYAMGETCRLAVQLRLVEIGQQAQAATP